MIKDEYESWVKCFQWTEQEKVNWLLNAVSFLENQPKGSGITHHDDALQTEAEALAKEVGSTWDWTIEERNDLADHLVVAFTAQRAAEVRAAIREVRRRVQVIDGAIEGCDGDELLRYEAKITALCELNNWLDQRVKEWEG
jgi:hypothetical protein